MHKRLQIQIDWRSKTCNKMADDRETLKIVALFVLDYIKKHKKNFNFTGYDIDTVKDQVQRQIAFVNYKLDYFMNTDEAFMNNLTKEINKAIKDNFGYSLEVRGLIKIC